MFSFPPYQEVVFKSPDGLRLKGYFAHKDINSPTIIICHTKGTSHNLNILQSVAKFLIGNNFNVLLFDFRGHGESEAAPFSFGWYERYDVLGAVDYLLAGKSVNPEKIAGFSISMGAAALVFAAAECPVIKAIAVESIYPRYEDHARIRIKDNFFLPGTPEQQQFLSLRKKALNISEDIAPMNYVQRISPRPILIMHGDADEDIPLSAAQKFYERALPPKEFWVIKGGNHYNCYFVDPEAYNRKLLGFFNGQPGKL